MIRAKETKQKGSGLPPQVEDERFLYSFDDLLKRVPVKKCKIYQEIKEGRLTAVRLGGRTVFRLEDILAWVKSLPKVELEKGIM